MVNKRYLDRYPRSGNVAVLCEGDIIGYETNSLKKWLPSTVDIWSCGTAKSIYGIADAIGRSRPVLIIEDRDFRKLDQAQKECGKKKKLVQVGLRYF